MRYDIYTRKSDDDKKVTEKSIGEQVQECRLIAAHNSLTVAECFEESKSAKVAGKRPLFTAMVRRIERGEVQGILCWHVNRLARNMTEGGRLADLMAEGKLREIRTPTSVFKTGDNIIPLVVETGTSTQYSLEVVRNVSRGLKGHYEQGGVTYKAPAGYRNYRDSDNPKRGIVIVDEPRFTIIRNGFDHILLGAYTIAQVRKMMNDEWGYRSRKGQPLSLPGAYKLFREPFYAGFVRYKGDIRKGNHTPMLTEEEFNRVQEILESKMRPRQKAVKKDRKFAFTGLMRCGYCGQQITAEHHTLTNGNLHTTYRCSDSWGRCTKRGMNEQDLQSAMAEEIAGVQIHPNLVEAALQTLLRDLGRQEKNLLDDYARDNANLKEVENKLWRLEEMYMNGLIESEERYREHLATLKAERQMRTARAAGTRLTLDEARESIHNAARFVLNAGKQFLSRDVKAQREIAMALAAEYRFYGREKRIEITLDPLLEGFVTFARSQPLPPQTGIRTGEFLEKNLFELPKIGSETTKKAPVKEALFIGGPPDKEVEPVNLSVRNSDRYELEAPTELVELCFTRKFPRVEGGEQKSAAYSGVRSGSATI